MNQPLYGVWLGDAFFCFSGEVSEPKVDAWSRVIRKVQLDDGIRPFAHASLRLAEMRYPVQSAVVKNVRRTERKTLGGRTMEGLALTPGDAFTMLLSLDAGLYQSKGLILGEEMEYWSTAARFALELQLRGRIAPGTAEVPSAGRRRSATMHMVKAVWKPQLTGEDAERFLQLAANIPPLCMGVPAALAGSEPATREEAGAVVLYSFLCSVIDAEAREAVRGIEGKLSSYLRDYRRGRSPLTELWWNSLLTVSRELAVQGAAEEVYDLTREVESAGHTVLPYTEGEDLPPENGNIRLGLRLEPPLEEGQKDWRLSLWAGGREDEGLWLPAHSIWSCREKDLLVRGRIYTSIQEQLLLAIGGAADQSAELVEGLRGPAPEGVVLPLEKLSSFMRESVPRLARTGVTVQMPSKWSREGRRRVGLSLKMMQDTSPNGGVDNHLPILGMEHLVSFEVSAAVGGQQLSREELAALAEANMPYVQFRGEWIEVDLKEINQVLRFMKRHEQGEMELSEWMHLTAEMDGERMWKGLFIEEVETTGLLSALLDGEGERRLPSRQIPSSLHGQLRPYQERGYQWLSVMRDLGFGVCLADDMGLGKTIQVITCLLDQRREAHSGPVLIVCPTSLLGNWQRELQRFAPDLSLYIHHGVHRLRGESFQQEALQYDIVLTTYHLAGRDGGDLSSVSWSSVVLDEAQYIKNYRTKQAQSVMKLSAPHRIAMTGTPVENRLGELWSIFHFLNPGYLGSFNAFRQRYALGEGQEERLHELHRLVSPFMLRRLKSDPDIRKDLPEKLEIKSYCPLTEVQGAMYQAIVDEMLGQIENRTGMARKGLVLSSLTKLKQICDHPQLLRGEDGRSPKMESSGKMQRLLEILDSIADVEESALIFTQYVGMGELLVKFLTKRYGKEPAFLHGGVPKKERDDMVRAFQEGEGACFFVLSLKAGGVGLNLTRANHVLHYDRWWNPAVENQATDRVFRIGQHKNVQVHKLISQGTLEERIDELIEQKKALSEQVVGSGETWLTEMSDGELRQLIELQGQDWM
ncbi:Superfamily II DNA or RNA helicase, SNF2 family [Paenibacillus uliginis N3/975]|uniref:Superfamily II DNA or RNA helicase, SNF2 family n=1 Tax=Paenibacillus uliginis N3/975 TaxID=1313296 RepID=A0A1X7HS18_9BACL|nr:DEAD/DEAH box helicase [Paenibacillus uliginis]SMF91049.1 Superfamily II DNA or RNA helicase, SNF2 family [Paenibacillus uliginis N3/975]